MTDLELILYFIIIITIIIDIFLSFRNYNYSKAWKTDKPKFELELQKIEQNFQMNEADFKGIRHEIQKLKERKPEVIRELPVEVKKNKTKRE